MAAAAEIKHRFVHLLDVNPDIGADLDGSDYVDARRLVTCLAFDLDPGPWDTGVLVAHPAVRGRVLACIVVSGLVVRELHLTDRVSTTLHGPRDVLGVDELAEVSLPMHVAYAAAVPTQLALLDDRFLAATRRWPWLAGRLVAEAAGQAGRGAAHQAISQLPRVEDRLVALFWHLADRWGRVGPDGIVIDLALTHEALGRLVGARRPTVSLGLQVLAERGYVTRRGTAGWLLTTASIEVLAHDAESLERLRSVLAAPACGPRAAAARLAPPQRQVLLDRLQRLRAELPKPRLNRSELLRPS